ncbi:MAG: hypothetical protein NTV33_13525 [Coprothermobacterota bacterium]|jgi:hypothetical protein|nr:hypothetical protein [Coprothermobacterota bacterium]
MNTGKHTLEWLFTEQLMIDEEWSTPTPRGFCWWADRNAQRIEVIGEEPGPDGQTVYFVSVRTELLRSIDLCDRALAAVNDLLMQSASMAGPVYEPSHRSLSLCSLVKVYEEIERWINPMIGTAAVLQIDEARTVGSELAKILNAEEAFTGHPQSGMRPEPDELAEVAAILIAPMGQQPSRWGSVEFQDVVEEYMKQPPALLGTAGDEGFTVEFPYGERSSLCQAMADQPHPRYGNGLLLLQSFPVTGKSDADGVRLALSMNAIELAQAPFGYGLGSYAYRDSMLQFTSFFPNALYRPGLLPNLFLACAARAREMSVRLVGRDWSPE